MRRILVLAALLAAACDTGLPGADEDAGGGPRRPIEPRFSDIEPRVFKNGCASFASCHDAQEPAGGLNLTAGAAYDELINVEAVMGEGRILVVPGDPEASFLIDKLRGSLAEEEGEAMPQRNPMLPEETIQAIEEWIAAGAAND